MHVGVPLQVLKEISMCRYVCACACVSERSRRVTAVDFETGVESAAT